MYMFRNDLNMMDDSHSFVCGICGTIKKKIKDLEMAESTQKVKIYCKRMKKTPKLYKSVVMLTEQFI